MLAILTTHPIQYQVPLWQALAADGRISFEVWYMSDHATRPSVDPGFGKTFAWDLDLLSGYPYRFLDMRGTSPNSFWGCRLGESMRMRLADCGVTALWLQGWQVAAYWQAVHEAKTAGVDVWMRAESNDLGNRSSLLARTKRLRLKYLFSRVDEFLYVGSANRRLYQQFGVPSSQLHPAPYAVDNLRFGQQAEAMRAKRQAVRHSWKIDDDAFCILFCGKFIGKKRPLDLIAAVRELVRTTQIKLHLLFVGAGELGGQLRAGCEIAFDAEALNGADHTGEPGAPKASFAGFLNQTEISRAYVAADCLVLPSDASETWGLVVNEAMACGLPCVASDACGCAEDLIASVDRQLTFPVGDCEALARAIVHVRHSPSPPAQLRNTIAKQSFDVSVETVVDLMQLHYAGSAVRGDA